MDADKYQTDALRTESTPTFVSLGLGENHDVMVSRMLHAVLGIMDEAGEMAKILKRHIIYKQAIDEVNCFEESGDSQWYQALWLSAIKKSLGEALEANLAKLAVRHGAKFNPEAAVNRDLAAERRALEAPKGG